MFAARSLFVALALVAVGCSDKIVPEYSSSSGSLAIAPGDKLAFVADEDNGAVGVIDLAAESLVATVQVGKRPQHVIAGKNGEAFVSNRGSRSVSIVKRTDLGWQVTGEVAVGAEPTGMALSPDGKMLAVANSSSASVSLIDVASSQVAGEIKVGGTPRALNFRPGGDLYVTDYFGGLSRVSIEEQAVVEQIGLGFTHKAMDGQHSKDFEDGMDMMVARAGPDSRSPTHVQAVALSPDGRRMYVVHAQAKDDVIATEGNGARQFDENPNGGGSSYGGGGGPTGSPPVVATAISTVDTESNQPLALSPDDDLRDFPPPMLLAGGGRQVLSMPSAVVAHPSGKWLFVANRSSNNLAVLSTSRLATDTFEDPDQGLQSTVAVGEGPTGLAITADGARALVHNSFDHTVSIIVQVADASGERLTELRLKRIQVGKSPLTVAQQNGRRLFHSAVDPRMTNQETGIACASCHGDGGRTDGRTWNFTEGPRNTPTLAYKEVLATAPYHWDGAILDIPDFQRLIIGRQGGMGLSGTDFGDLMAFLAIIPEPDNPNTGAVLTAEQEMGKHVFNDTQKANCTGCHAGAAFTDNKMQRTQTPFGVNNLIATPPLRGLFGTAPYLHDGSAVTVRDTITRPGPIKEMYMVGKLSQGEIDALVAYVETL